MKEFFESKNFLITLLVVGAVFIVIVVSQFVSIISLNNKNDQLNSKLNNLTQQEQYYNGLYNEASKEDYAENYAKNEQNMKNEDDTVYKGA